MSKRVQTVVVLKADGTPSTIAHRDREKEALAQFRGALQGAGHHEQKIEYHLGIWIQMRGQGQTVYEVLNPDLQGAVRISTTQR